MACVPGTPCYPTQVNAVYPKKCNNGWFAGYPINTNLICYNGPNLPNTGVDTGDNLNLVLEKIDQELDPVSLVQTILQTILTNPSLNVSFCTLVNACVANNTTTTTTSSSSTTTTTTSSSTTTTTTTIAPPTTTTTTTVPNYYYYSVDRYSCVDCSVLGSFIMRAQLSLSTLNTYVLNLVPDGYGYKVISQIGTSFTLPYYVGPYDFDLNPAWSSSSCSGICSVVP
jgi:hypothetical protein